MDAITPADRAFLQMPTPPVTGFFLDFIGSPPAQETWARRILDRAGTIPTLLHTPPAPRDRTWTSRAEPLCPDTHLHHHPLPTRPHALSDACETLLARPLPPAPHPPWDIHLLTQPSTPERFRVALRIHHGHQDGVGAAHTAIALLCDTPTAGPHAHPAQRPRSTTTLAAGLRLAAPLLRPDPARPVLRAALGGTNGPQWDYKDIPLTRLRALADAHHCTVNDVCLAALALALRALLPQTTSRPPHLLMALSTRRPDQSHAPGNHVGAHRLLLPTTATTLPAALTAIRQQTAALRRDHVRDAQRRLLTLRRPLSPSPRLLRTLLGPHLYPLATSSITFPNALTCFDARLEAASMFLTVGPYSPVYLSITRTLDTVRCTAIADAPRRNAMALPQHWKHALANHPC
ncbi:wax ester/triacylglycerol synthase domain-containing protein [Streptomyces sp. NPDC018000]|uniref:wax ester/triacylglycerol synthase domain-containing protein n=1 Tax=Streptomyces sp. NPDC018000 TaxID=3365028 RepID=UPI003792B1C3